MKSERFLNLFCSVVLMVCYSGARYFDYTKKPVLVWVSILIGVLAAIPVIKLALNKEKQDALVVVTDGRRHIVKLNRSHAYDIVNSWANENGFVKHPSTTSSNYVYTKGGRFFIPTFVSYDGDVLQMWIQMNGKCQSVMEGPGINIPRNNAKKDLAKLMKRLGSV